MDFDKCVLWAKGKSIDEILEKRDEFEYGTPEWMLWNRIKAEKLESLKPSTKEQIIFFKERDLKDIPLGLTLTDKLPNVSYYVGKRSLLEYNSEQRHPIPYCIIRHDNYYFFINREKSSGEIRLIGKKGMLGGHVGAEDMDDLSLSKTLLNGLRRELKEEAGITDELIKSINLKGILKSNEGVDKDHLGIIYEIELISKDITSQEEALTDMWLHEDELSEHRDTFESWASIIYDTIIR